MAFRMAWSIVAGAAYTFFLVPWKSDLTVWPSLTKIGVPPAGLGRHQIVAAVGQRVSRCAT